MEAAGRGVGMEKRGGMMAEAAGRTLSQVVQVSPPPPGQKKSTKYKKKGKQIKEINDRQKSFTASGHSIQPIQTNQNGSSSG